MHDRNRRLMYVTKAITVLVNFLFSCGWLGGRMPDSRSREPGHESPPHIGAIFFI